MKPYRPSFRAVCLALLLCTAGSASASPLANQAVGQIDLQRYSGLWYEIAHLPMYFQRMCTSDITATYTVQADGRIAVRNRCRTEDGSFRQADGQARSQPGGNARLEVRFAPGWLSWLPWAWADYWVIALDPEYRWAMVGGPKAQNLWILSRTPEMAPQTYQALVEQARRMGYPVQGLLQAPHTHGQLPASPD